VFSIASNGFKSLFLLIFCFYSPLFAKIQTLDFFASAELMREVDAFSCIRRMKIDTDRCAVASNKTLRHRRNMPVSPKPVIVAGRDLRRIHIVDGSGS
jgi:hypothetical protein